MATPTPVFPGSIATTEQLKVANNLVFTSLTVALPASSLIMWVKSTAGFVPNSLVSVDNEIIAITAVVNTPSPALMIAAGGRGFDGTTTTTHAAGAKVAMLIGAWHHNVLSTEIQAIETFLGANGQNITGQLSGTHLASAYMFAQQPGGSLSPGTNVITLAPVPPGVNGNNVGHYLCISGGTGAAETVLVTGGTAVAGAASGTLFFTCVNAHSGAWTIQSATGGIYEAARQFATDNVNAVLMIDKPISICGQINITNSSKPRALAIVGQGAGGAQITRSPLYPTGDLFRFTSAQIWPSIILRDLDIEDGPYDGAWKSTGVAIHFLNYGYTPAVLDNVRVIDAHVGILIEGSQLITIRGGYIGWHEPVIAGNMPLAGIEIQRSATSMPSNIVISGTAIQGVYSASRPNVFAGIVISSTDGVMVSDVMVSQLNMGIVMNDNAYYLNLTNSILDWCENPLVLDASTGVLLGPVEVSNCWIGGCAASANPGPTANMLACIQVTATSTAPGAAVKFAFNGNIIQSGGIWGIRILGPNISAATIAGNDISGNNSTKKPYGAGIVIGQGASNLAITGNTLRDIGPAVGLQNYGIEIADPNSKNLTIVGNMLQGNLVEPLVFAAPPVGSCIATNSGVDDAVQTIAATGNLPLGPYPFYVVTGTTPISTISGGWAGRTVTLQFTDASPGGVVAGGNIHTAKTALQNATVSLRHDGAKWMVV